MDLRLRPAGRVHPVSRALHLLLLPRQALGPARGPAVGRRAGLALALPWVGWWPVCIALFRAPSSGTARNSPPFALVSVHLPLALPGWDCPSEKRKQALGVEVRGASSYS